MKAKHYLFVLGCGLVMLILLSIDLFTKALAHMQGEHGYIGPWFLNFVRLDCFAWNPGMAFGLVGDSPEGMAVITVITAVLIVGIAVMYFTLFKKNTPVRICLMVIEAGAIGNFIDRVCFPEGVRDFIDVVRVWFIPSYTCNVADIYIVFGAIALVFCILFIGPRAVWPLTKKWREEAKRLDEEKEQKKKA